MLTRRQFLKSGCAAVAATTASSLTRGARADPGCEAEYRALVCVALGGGADSFNMLVPTDASRYAVYARRRGALAVNTRDLLPLRSGETGSYALHRGLSELQKHCLAGEVALIANAGPLQGLGQCGTGAPDPSHTDLIARWQLGQSDCHSRSGWAGRVADLLQGPCRLDQLPMNVSLSGRNAMQLGERTLTADLQAQPYRQYAASRAGIDFSYLYEQLEQRAVDAGRPGSIGRKTKLQNEVDLASRQIVGKATAGRPGFESRFGSDPFSADLERIARIIASRDQLGARRQIFFVHLDGWDHHHELLASQETLLAILDNGLSAFRDALVELSVFDDVTTFTISEFGRCLEPNGSGSDHGWGGHHIVMGGSVLGGEIYGRFPDLSSSSPLDIGGGCFKPTTSTDEYLAELALWLGVPPSDLAYVFPDLSRFWLPGNQARPLGMLA